MLSFLRRLVKHTGLCRVEPSSTTEYPQDSRLFPECFRISVWHIPEFGIASQIVRCDMLQVCSFAASLDHIPHNILGDAFCPTPLVLATAPKDPALCDSGCSCPLVEGCFDPGWNRGCADVPTLANEIHHGPVPPAHLDLSQLQADKFRSAKTTTQTA